MRAHRQGFGRTRKYDAEGMNRRTAMAMAMLSVLPPSRVGFAQNLGVIELRNRPAEQIIPIVRAMLDRNGVMTCRGFPLMLRTSPQSLAKIR